MTRILPTTLCTLITASALFTFLSSTALAQNVIQKDFLRSTGRLSAGAPSTGGPADSMKKNFSNGAKGLHASKPPKHTRKGRK